MTLALPETDYETREDMLFAAADGLRYDWAPVVLGGGRLVVQVTADALRWSDGVRYAVSCRLAQRLADATGSMLLTPLVSDAVWRQATLRVGPFPRAISATTSALRSHAAQVEHAVDTHDGLVAGWKDWVLAERCWAPPLRACNYGWHVDSAGSWRGIPTYAAITTGPGRVIQPAGFAHSVDHVDYSQLCRLMYRHAILDGREVDLADVMTDPETARLLCHDGPLPGWRHPAVPDSARTPPRQPAPPRRVEEPPESTGPVTQPAPSYSAEEVEMIPARHYTREPRPLTAIRWVVLHSTENPCRPGVARNVARWFSGPSSPQASAHYIVGPDEVVACVPLEHAAWAAPGANANGVQIEMVGQARLTDWTSGPGLLVLERTAGLVAALCRQLELPLVRLDAEALLRGEPGVTSHAMVTDAARLARQRGLRVAPWWRADRSSFVGGDHQDPGGPGDRRWPWDLFLKAAAAG